MRPLSQRAGPLGVALTLGQVALAVRQHWMDLPPRTRNRLQALIVRSGGRPGNLSVAERRELRDLVSELRLADLGRSVAGTAAGARGRFGRRR